MNLKEKYKKEVVKEMRKKFGYKNDLAVPRLEKVVVNVGVGKTKEDPKFLTEVEKSLILITGQKPLPTKAKKSISGFKIKKNMIVGLKVTLRGGRMYDFVEKLINIALPRIRDFKGLSLKSLSGNALNIGFREQIVFPEITSIIPEKIHGLEVTVVTNAKTKEEALELFKLLGFRFRE